ncbi:MAG: hypothetical protein AAGD15_01890 [Agrobacterium cavarae]|uniref:hypothetical protein n=1 Tax=Agrobacterium cavarae TaxID=2528239 RepID=UPI0031A07510
MRVPRRLARVGAAADLPNAAAFDAYVGPSGELTVDHVRGIIALHNGSTAGGVQFKIASLLPAGGTTGQVVARAASGGAEWVDQTGGSGGSSSSDSLLALALSEATSNHVATRQVFADGFKSLGSVNTGGATNLDTSEVGYLKPTTSGGTTKGSASASGSTTAPTNGFLIVDRTYAVDNNVLISKIGIYSTTAGSGSFKIMNEDSTTQFDILYTQNFTHAGAGWQDFTLSTPFQTPTTGTLRIGTRFASGGPTGTVVATGNRASINSDPGVQNNLGGFTSDSAGVFSSRYSYGLTAANLSVNSEILPCPIIPSSIAGALRIVAVDAATLNTDLMFDVRRSSSASWATATLELDFLDGGVSVLKFAPVSLTSQASDDDVQWRFRTANGKMVKLDGAALEYRA